jgi:hypothetical protein
LEMPIPPSEVGGGFKSYLERDLSNGFYASRGVQTRIRSPRVTVRSAEFRLVGWT